MFGQLGKFYYYQAKKGVDATRIVALSPHTFGPANKPACHLKAAETLHFMPFLHERLESSKHLYSEQWPTIESASKSLLKILELVKAHPWTMPLQAQNDITPFVTGSLQSLKWSLIEPTSPKVWSL